MYDITRENPLKINKKYAIGVFDSGLGGLTVVRELRRYLPREDIVYFGDTARLPYGTKSKDAIIRFSIENVRFLIKKKVKIIVVACNSSSSFAVPILKKSFSLPIIEVVRPGAMKAVEVTQNQKVGIIATSATIQSKKYYQEIKSLKPQVQIVSQACPLFVPLVEEGWVNEKVAYDIAKKYLKGLKEVGVDTLILGCTHYPILKSIIARAMGKKVSLVDSAYEVAREAKRVLNEKNLSCAHQRKGHCRFFVSDKPQHFQMLARRFLGYRIDKIRKV